MINSPHNTTNLRKDLKISVHSINEQFLAIVSAYLKNSMSAVDLKYAFASCCPGNSEMWETLFYTRCCGFTYIALIWHKIMCFFFLVF